MKTVLTEVRLSFPVSNLNPNNYAAITLIDRASGVTYASFELDSDQFTAFLASRGASVPVELLDDKVYHRVGKKYVWGKLEFPQELATRWGSRDVTPEMMDFGATAATEAGWSDYRWQLHNYGWSLSGYRWDEIEAEVE